jgi:hypothetical protein
MLLPKPERLSESMFYSPFSPRWIFTFNGHTNKGATKVFPEKMDEELDL